MKRQHCIALVLGVVVALTSCQETWRDLTREAVLEVEGEILYLDEIQDFIPDGVSPKDSAYLAESYKKQWITRTLMYKNAYKNVGNNEDIQKLTEAYRKELIINQYQQQLIAEKLKEIPEATITQYYETSKDKFLLDECIIKGIFIKTPSSETNKAELLELLSNTTDEHLENTMRFCTQHAVMYEFFNESWTSYSKIGSLMPETIDQNDPALTRGTIVQEKEGYSYFLRVTGKCDAGKPKPYEMIKNELRNILLNQEKIKFINQFQQSLYNDAVENGEIKYFENE